MIGKVEKSIILFLILWALVACSTPSTGTIPPSPQPVNVSLSPSLEPARNALHICAINLPDIALFVDTVPASSQDFNKYDLIISWGEKPGKLDRAFPLGQDEIVIIINSDNPNNELSTNEVMALFNGRVEEWTEISLFDQPVSVWTFPPENIMSDTFGSAILKNQSFSHLANLAPSSQAMLEAIAGDPGGIGYILKSWLPDDVSPSSIEPELQNVLRKPILALVNSEPQGNLLDLLNCLQSGMGQDQLLEHYSPIN